jgi:hypothetical protein
VNALSSPLGRNAPSASLSREELDRLRERAWQEAGLVCLYPDEISSEFVRQGAVNEMVGRFGRRMKR